MEIKNSIEEGIYSVTLTGSFILDGVVEVQKETESFLEDQSLKGVLIDFKAVDMVDSSGIGLTVLLHKHLKKRNLHFILYHMNPHVREAYSIAGIDEIITICETEKEAQQLLHAKN